MASRTPGDLGVYGFRNRSDHSYDGLFIANGTAIKEPRLWDLATRAASARSCSACRDVPTPAAQRRHGHVLPDAVDRVAVHVPAAAQARGRAGRRRVPVRHEGLPDEKKDWLLEQIYEMTDRRFTLAEHLVATKPWELFAMVEMGPTGCTTASGRTWT